jgi:hypothetical protein
MLTMKDVQRYEHSHVEPQARGQAESRSQLRAHDHVRNALTPQVAIGSSGDAFAVWSQSGSVWASRCAPSTGWGVAERIAADDAGDAFDPQVAVDPSGNALAVWSQPDDAGFSQLWANHFTPNMGWGVAERISGEDGRVGAARVALDPEGNALAVWNQMGSIWANQFTPRSGWSNAERITADEQTADAVDPQIALDPDGNGLAIWSQDDGLRGHTIWASCFAQATGWGVAERISAGGYAVFPQIAIDPDGEALAVWSQSRSICANRFARATGWGVAERISDAGHAVSPQVDVDPSGNALAVWSQRDGLCRQRIYANWFTPAAGWGLAERIATDNAGDAFDPQVAIDPDGNALAVWCRDDGLGWYTICASRFTPATGWSIAQRIATGDAGDAADPQVAMQPSGRALAVWSQSGSIWVHRFEPRLPAP